MILKIKILNLCYNYWSYCDKHQFLGGDTMADTTGFWTAKEVFTYLRIPRSTLYKLAQSEKSHARRWEGMDRSEKK